VFPGGQRVDISYRLTIIVFSVWEDHRRTQIIGDHIRSWFKKNVNQRQRLLDTDSIAELQNKHPSGLPPVGETHFHSNNLLKTSLDWKFLLICLIEKL